MNLGQAIREIRKEKRIKAFELAERSGISKTALYNIERGICFPSKKTIDALADSLGVPVGMILFLSISENDIPEDKRGVFGYLYESIKKLLS